MSKETTASLDFKIDSQKIAFTPLKERDSSRLLVIKPDALKEMVFCNIIDLLNPGDVLVLNNTKVIKSRVLVSYQEKIIEFFLHSQLDDNKWKAFVKPARKVFAGQSFTIQDHKLLVLEKLGYGEFIVQVNTYNNICILEFLDRFGQIPLPPYIKRPYKKSDENDYQTVFAKNHGSVAAPTAGLHFTQKLLEQIKLKKIKPVYITLHVGKGTFMPIKEENIDAHQMHCEHYEIKQEAADIINQAKKAGNRIIATGTTSLRALETSYVHGSVVPQKSTTNLFVKPGFKFNVVDLLLTNFHMPKSTLLLLVWAFGGTDNMKRAYDFAMKNNFRLFSYGDTSLIYKNS